MILHSGFIYFRALDPLYPPTSEVVIFRDDAARLESVNDRKKCTVFTYFRIKDVDIHDLKQIVIATKEKVNDLSPDVRGFTVRPLRSDQVNLALANYDLSNNSSEIKIQFGIWQENGKTYFQIPSAIISPRGKSREERIFDAARIKDDNGNYFYPTFGDISDINL